MKQKNLLLIVGAIAVIGFFLYSGGFLPFTIAAVSQVSLSDNAGAWIITAGVPAGDSTINLGLAGKEVKLANGTIAKAHSNINIVLDNVKAEYRALRLQQLSSNNGELFRSSYLFGDLRCNADPLGLAPYSFSDGVTVVTYDVSINQDGTLIEKKPITFPSQDANSDANSFSMVGGKVVFQNLGQLNSGYSHPELANVVMVYDSDSMAFSGAKAKDEFINRLETGCGKTNYACSSTDIFKSDKDYCKAQARNTLKDVSAPSGYFGNFEENGFKFDGTTGVWRMKQGTIYPLIVITVSTDFAKTVFLSPMQGKAQISNVRIADGNPNQNTYGSLCADVTNVGGGFSEFYITHSNSNGNNGITPANQYISLAKGQTETVCFTYFGQTVETTKGTIRACPSSQFSSPDCVDAQFIVETVATGGTNKPIGGSGTVPECGQNQYWDKNNNQCRDLPFGVGETNWLLIFFVALVAIVILVLLIPRRGKK